MYNINDFIYKERSIVLKLSYLFIAICLFGSIALHIFYLLFIEIPVVISIVFFILLMFNKKPIFAEERIVGVILLIWLLCLWVPIKYHDIHLEKVIPDNQMILELINEERISFSGEINVATIDLNNAIQFDTVTKHLDLKIQFRPNEFNDKRNQEPERFIRGLNACLKIPRILGNKSRAATTLTIYGYWGSELIFSTKYKKSGKNYLADIIHINYPNLVGKDNMWWLKNDIEGIGIREILIKTTGTQNNFEY